MATQATLGFWYSDTPISWTSGVVEGPPEPLPADAAEWGWYVVPTGTDPDVNPYALTAVHVMYRGDGYLGYDHPPDPDNFGSVGGTTEPPWEGPWRLPSGDLYLYAWGATFSSSDPEPTLPDPPVKIPATRWFRPPPVFAQSQWIENAHTAPPEYRRSAAFLWTDASGWADLVETSDGGDVDPDVGAFLEVEVGASLTFYRIGQSLYHLPLQSAWDSTYTYPVGGSPPNQDVGDRPPYLDPPDPTAPVPLPSGTVIFDSEGYGEGYVLDPVVAQLYVKPLASRIDWTDPTPHNVQGFQSLTFFELPPTSPYHPDSNGGNFAFVPRSVLLTLDVLWQGVPVNDVTTAHLPLSVNLGSGDWNTDVRSNTSVLVVPTAMLSTTPPAAGGGPGTHWVEFLRAQPEVEVQYVGPRYLVLLDGVVGVLKVKQPDGTWRKVGCPEEVDPGGLKLWTGEEWVVERCAEDATPGHPLKLWDGTTWQTVACMVPAEAP